MCSQEPCACLDCLTTHPPSCFFFPKCISMTSQVSRKPHAQWFTTSLRLYAQIAMTCTVWLCHRSGYENARRWKASKINKSFCCSFCKCVSVPTHLVARDEKGGWRRARPIGDGSALGGRLRSRKRRRRVKTQTFKVKLRANSEAARAQRADAPRCATLKHNNN